MRRIEGFGGGIEEEGFGGGFRRRDREGGFQRRDRGGGFRTRVGKEGCGHDAKLVSDLDAKRRNPKCSYDTATSKRTNYLQTKKQ